jgi:hypothetical protein
MPEFRRSWVDWAPSDRTIALHYRPDEADKSPSVSLVRPTAPASQDVSGGCLRSDCSLTGHSVELGGQMQTRLCARHRRELFRRARELSEAEETTRSPLLEQRVCRCCGHLVGAENDPCRECAAANSPLVQVALRMGARPICSCGAAAGTAGGACAQCGREPDEWASKGYDEDEERR